MFSAIFDSIRFAMSRGEQMSDGGVRRGQKSPSGHCVEHGGVRDVAAAAHIEVSESGTLFGHAEDGGVREAVAVAHVEVSESHEALAVTRQVARGLHHLHAQGYCHNDVKLENVVLFGGGEEGDKKEENKAAGGPCWKIVDLELCHPVGSPPRHLQDKVPGTWAYASPEKEDYRRGVAALHCPLASDMWALGVLLHLCTKGIFPNGTTDPDPLVQTYRPPRRHRGRKGDGGVEFVLSRLLCPHPQRWTAEKLTLYLEAAQAPTASSSSSSSSS